MLNIFGAKSRQHYFLKSVQINVKFLQKQVKPLLRSRTYCRVAKNPDTFLGKNITIKGGFVE